MGCNHPGEEWAGRFGQGPCIDRMGDPVGRMTDDGREGKKERKRDAFVKAHACPADTYHIWLEGTYSNGQARVRYVVGYDRARRRSDGHDDVGMSTRSFEVTRGERCHRGSHDLGP